MAPKTYKFFPFVIAGIVVLALLKIFDVVTITTGDISAALLVLVGIGIVINYFGENAAAILFIGNAFFFLGVLIFLYQNFLFENDRILMWQSIPFILGMSFLLLFVDQTAKKIYFALSLLFLFVFGVLLFNFGSFNLSSAVVSARLLIEDYYIFILVLLLMIVIASRK